MLKKTVMACFFVCLMAVNALAADKGAALWMDIGNAGGHMTYAANIRFGCFGLSLGFGSDMDYEDKEVLDAAPMDPAVPMQITPEYMGRKKVGPAYGGDVMFFLDVMPRLSVYAGPGMYFQEYRKVYKIVEINNPASYAWHEGAYYNKEYGEYELKFGGVVGVQGKVKEWPSGKSLVLGANYHSIRGISGSIGLAW